MTKVILFGLILTTKFLIFPAPPTLQNFGCSCYVNTMIQNFYAIQPLTQILINTPNLYPAGSLPNLFTQLLRSNFSPNDLKKFYTQVAKTHGRGNLEQQDPTEFLGEFLLYLRNDLTKSLLVSEILSEISCPKGTCDVLYPDGYKSEKMQEETFFFVPVSGSSLYDCITEYFNEETLAEYTPFGCPPIINCCTKQLRIEKPADIFIVGLKRFKKDLSKITDPIAIPLELNLAPWIINTKDTFFDLIGVMMHVGNNLKGGHYTAYVKHDNQWWYCNDTLIAPVTPDQILSDGKLEFKNVILGGTLHNLVPMPIYSIKKGYVYIYQNKNLIVSAPLISPPQPPVTQPDLKNLETTLHNLTGALNNLQKALTSKTTP